MSFNKYLLDFCTGIGAIILVAISTGLLYNCIYEFATLITENLIFISGSTFGI